MTSDGGTTWVKTSDTVNITDISFASVSVGLLLLMVKHIKLVTMELLGKRKMITLTLIKSLL